MKLQQKLRRILLYVLPALDAVFFLLAFNLSHWLWLGEIHSHYALVREVFLAFAIYFLVAFVFNAHDVTSRDLNINFTQRYLIGAGVAALLIIFLLFTLEARYAGGLLGRGPFLLGLLLFILFGYLGRVFISKAGKISQQKYRILFVSSLKASEYIFADIQKSTVPIEVTLLYDPALAESTEGEKLLHELQQNPVVKGQKPWTRLHDFLNQSYSGVVLGLHETYPEYMIQQLQQARFRGLHFYELSDFYELVFQKVPVFHLRHGWFIFSTGFNLLHSGLSLRIKRFMDIGLSFLFLLLASPVMALTALLIKLDSRGPVIFAQERTGLNGKPFTLYKFRSMTVDAEKDGAQWAQENDKRVTRVGRFLRLLRIDELPQLWNVFRGDMSFIGPRPERPVFNAQLEKEIPYYNLRHLIKPGITGWAQVIYPYGASQEDAREKLQYELYYLKNFSILLDLNILFQTIRVVLLGKGR